MIFDVIINEIAFLIFFPESFLLMCRNKTDFYILILYPEVFVNLFLSSKSVLVVLYSVMSSANIDSVASSFQI